MAQLKAWSAGSFAKWTATWLAVYTASLLVGYVLYLWARGFGSLFSKDLFVLMIAVLVICLPQGAVSIGLLWALGRNRQPRAFRKLSLLLLIALWLPLQVALLMLEVAPAWLLASILVALLIRPPEPAYYGRTGRRRLLLTLTKIDR